MATVYFTMTAAMGGGAPVYSPRSSNAQKLTSSGTSQLVSFTANGGEYLRVSSVGGAVSIKVGSSPTAISGGNASHWITDGATIDLGPLTTGDTVAVIDA